MKSVLKEHYYISFLAWYRFVTFPISFEFSNRRFSRDIETIDNNLPMNFRTFLATFFGALSTFAVIVYTTPYFAIVLLPMGLLYYMVQVRVCSSVTTCSAGLYSLTRSSSVTLN